jgi:hypothetical protein
MNMSLPRTYYLIYSPAVAEQLASVIAHPLLAEQGMIIKGQSISPAIDRRN